ncbi:exodeoxyribonuclease III [Azohydromonas caseinilytica]|uniref:Exodeoxyribonuclease III n=1 Tax=Azohydromonas caseinilytica TaxID=2728836 RepID=A0A848FDM8_9BURK|nr:exodeoxyribonuclease III [Azohydromonas caseinilytica]NML16260.1 exodeoxyribonuclease III [Azohydromonas caseinilytica]
MGFRVVTLNLNGIRSAATKGFEAWAEAAGADFMGVQEVRAQEADVVDRFKRVAGLEGHFHFAQKKGYSGVGLYTKRDPSAVITGFGCDEFDPEGRYVELRFDSSARKFSVISAYFPSGSSGEERQAAKFRFLERFWHHLAALRASGREFILMGDFNIAHQAIDLKNWRGNQKNSGFLPEERAWFSRMVSQELGLVDVYRRLHPEATEDCYTWWSNRGQAWAKNVGWRLDYQVATPEIAHSAHAAAVHKASRFSDHAPLTIDYGLSL